MAEDGLRWIDKALPLDDVDSSDIDLAGRLAELDRLAITLDDLTGEHPLPIGSTPRRRDGPGSPTSPRPTPGCRPRLSVSSRRSPTTPAIGCTRSS